MAIATLQAASDRPLPFRKRPDLSVHPQRLAGRTYLGLKDPLSLRYYQLREEEFFILQQLDGRAGAQEIQAAFDRAFAPQRLSLGQLHGFLSLLHREGLLVADTAGQGEQLRLRGQATRRQQWLAALSNPLVIRFPGLDPDALLRRLYLYCRWLFSPAAIVMGLLLVVAAGLLIAVQFDTWQRRLPGFQDFFSPSNWLWFVLALALAKVLHEFGHGLTCRHFGGECHELGVMLLVFTPCLYVDVSDSWRLANKWHRAAIAAAGMYVELVLAAICAFAWWFSGPGMLNAICLRLMFVCSVSTVLFNANPLLRYDGYYVLSDILEVPNLYAHGRALVGGLLSEWFLGLAPTSERMLPERGRGGLAAYAVAAATYRLGLIIGILWLLHELLGPLGLQAVAQGFSIVVVAGLLVEPLRRAAGFLADPVRRGDMPWRRLALAAALGSALLAAAFTIPWPCHVSATALLEVADARRVYVSVAGHLVEAVEPETPVVSGQALARLENPELRLEVVRLAGQRALLQSQLDGLRSRSTQRVQQGLREPIAEIPATKQALADLEQRLQRRLDELERLIVKAPAAGTFLPPRAQPKNVGKSELAMWTDTPLDPRNRGCHLETGTWLGLVGDPARLDATLLVEQAEVEFVRVGQHVTLHLDQQPAEFLRGAVCEISELDAEAAPPELIAAGLLPLRVAAQGTVRLARPYCRVRVTLAEHNLRVRPGAAGRARIHTAARSLGQRAVRYLEQIFDGRLWARATTPIRRSWPGNTRSERRILTSSNGTC